MKNNRDIDIEMIIQDFQSVEEYNSILAEEIFKINTHDKPDDNHLGIETGIYCAKCNCFYNSDNSMGYDDYTTYLQVPCKDC